MLNETETCGQKQKYTSSYTGYPTAYPQKAVDNVENKHMLRKKGLFPVDKLLCSGYERGA